jgi:hypothetical protein
VFIAKRTVWLGVFLIVACGGVEDSTPGTDAETDSAEDVIDDASADSAEDAIVDSTDSGADSAPDPDSTSGDTASPRLRDLRASIDGPVSTDVDLNGADAVVHIPVASIVTFTVFASDETSSSDALVIDFLDANGVALSPDESSYRNGLWSASVVLTPGVSLRTRVADEAGNVLVSEAALVAPSIAESILGEWSTRYFGAAQTQVSVRHHEWHDGTWSAVEGEYDASGIWAFDGEYITVETLETTGDPEPLLRAAVYVDNIYFSIAPLWLQSGGTNGLNGVWQSTAWSGQPEVELETALTLEGDGTFSMFIGESTSSGTWHTEVNEDYSEAFGNFLVVETSTRDGGALAEVESEVLLYRRRGDALLISPELRDAE